MTTLAAKLTSLPAFDTGTSFAAKAPTLTKPSGAAVIDTGNAECGRDLLFVHPIVRDANNEAYRLRVYGWTEHRRPQVYSAGTITVTAAGVVTLAGDDAEGNTAAFPYWAAAGEIEIEGRAYTINTRDSATQVTLDNTAIPAVTTASPYRLARPQHENQSLWIPTLLLSVDCTAGNISAADIQASTFMADTITYVAGDPDAKIVSPTGDVPGYFVLDVMGCQKVEFDFDVDGTSGTTSAGGNVLYRFVNSYT